MNDTRLPVVAGIGSCRIFTPLTLLGRSKKVRLAQESKPWYTHSTKDALQKIDIVNKHTILDDFSVPLVVHGIEKYMPQEFREGFYDDAEAFVIEIASIKTLKLGNLEIQQWCIRDQIVAADYKPQEFNRLVQLPPEQRDVSNVPSALSVIAKNAIPHTQSEQDIWDDLVALRTKLNRPLILVPNINVEGDKGQLLPERVMISRILETFSSKHGELFFDPAVHVREYGIKGALKDLGHYTPEFEKVLAGKFGEAIAQRLSAQKQIADNSESQQAN